jgi:Mn-dependent DtxR family transcriptional regulator
MLKFMNQYRHTYVEKTKDAQNIDKILSKKILQHLQIFFNKKSQNKTIRKTNKTHNKTKKKKQNLP